MEEYDDEEIGALDHEEVSGEKSLNDPLLEGIKDELLEDIKEKRWLWRREWFILLCISSVRLSIHPAIPFIYLFIHLFIYLLIYFFTYLLIYFIYLFIYLFVYLLI